MFLAPVVLILCIQIIVPIQSSLAMATGGLLSVEFEIFGRVQGVFFRKYTKINAKKLGLVGWVMNTHMGTVQGEMQGASDKVHEMNVWLRTKGSKHSRIDKAVFSGERRIDKLTFSDFVVKH